MPILMIPSNEFTNPYINDDNEKGYSVEILEQFRIEHILSGGVSSPITDSRESRVTLSPKDSKGRPAVSFNPLLITTLEKK